MEINSPLRVLLAEDEPMYLKSMTDWLKMAYEHCAVTSVTNGNDLAALAITHDFDLILTDISMPGLNGILATQKIIEQKPDALIIALTHFDEEYNKRQMLRAGARAFLDKSADEPVLKKAVTVVTGGGYYVGGEVWSREQVQDYIQQHPGGPFNLSRRELEVLQCICDGLNNRQIADKLCISERTVEGHRCNLLAKTNCNNTAKVVAFAVKKGLAM